MATNLLNHSVNITSARSFQCNLSNHLKTSPGTVCLSHLLRLQYLYLHIVLIFWLTYTVQSLTSLSASRLYCKELRQKPFNVRVELAPKLFFGHICASVCVLCFFFVLFFCVWKIGWQHVCHYSPTLLLLSGAADGCLANAPVRMTIHQLKQMLNADISCIGLTVVIKDPSPSSIHRKNCAQQKTDCIPFSWIITRRSKHSEAK